MKKLLLSLFCLLAVAVTASAETWEYVIPSNAATYKNFWNSNKDLTTAKDITLTGTNSSNKTGYTFTAYVNTVESYQFNGSVGCYGPQWGAGSTESKYVKSFYFKTSDFVRKTIEKVEFIGRGSAAKTKHNITLSINGINYDVKQLSGSSNQSLIWELESKVVVTGEVKFAGAGVTGAGGGFGFNGIRVTFSDDPVVTDPVKPTLVFKPAEVKVKVGQTAELPLMTPEGLTAYYALEDENADLLINDSGILAGDTPNEYTVLVTTKPVEGKYLAGEGSFKVIVEALTAPELKFSYDSIEIEEEEIVDLPKITPEGLTATYSYDKEGLIIDSTKIQGVKPGTYTVEVTTAANKDYLEGHGSFTVVVKAVDKRKETVLLFESETYTTTFGQPFESPELTTDDNVTPITWTSSNESVATVADGVVTIKGIGTTVITASFNGNDEFKPCESASYTLTVKDPNGPMIGRKTATFNFMDNNYGMDVHNINNGAGTYEEKVKSFSEGNITITPSGKYRIWGASDGNQLRVQKLTNNVEGGLKFSCSEGKIVSISWTGSGTLLAADGKTSLPSPIKFDEESNITDVEYALNTNLQLKTITVEYMGEVENLNLALGSQTSDTNSRLTWSKDGVAHLGNAFCTDGLHENVNVTIKPVGTFDRPENFTELHHHSKGLDSWIENENDENELSATLLSSDELKFYVPCSGIYEVTLEAKDGSPQKKTAIMEIEPSFAGLCFDDNEKSIVIDGKITIGNGDDGTATKHRLSLPGWYNKVEYIWEKTQDLPDTTPKFESRAKVAAQAENEPWVEVPADKVIEFPTLTRGNLRLRITKNGLTTESPIYTLDVATGVEEIFAEEGVAEFYTLSGLRVYGDLQPGLYIVRKGGKSAKILVK